MRCRQNSEEDDNMTMKESACHLSDSIVYLCARCWRIDLGSSTGTSTTSARRHDMSRDAGSYAR